MIIVLCFGVAFCEMRLTVRVLTVGRVRRLMLLCGPYISPTVILQNIVDMQH
jgi:hypothetical protein